MPHRTLSRGLIAQNDFNAYPSIAISHENAIITALGFILGIVPQFIFPIPSFAPTSPCQIPPGIPAAPGGMNMPRTPTSGGHRAQGPGVTRPIVGFSGLGQLEAKGGGIGVSLLCRQGVLKRP